MSKLGLIAGNGELPALLASSAMEAGREIVGVALSSEAEKRLKSLSVHTHRHSPVEVYPILNLLKQHQTRELVFIGKVPKLEFFKTIHKLDPKLLSLVRALPDMHDDTLHHALLNFLEKEHGLTIANQTQYLRKYFPKPQVFTKRQPTTSEREEINYGLKIAKSLGGLDIGQTAVIQNKSVIAIEAIEGTNACIKRARGLVRWTPNRHITVCKASKPNQDQRFDVPTVGIKTVRELGRGDILAIEAGETMFLNQEDAIKYADARGICILAV